MKIAVLGCGELGKIHALAYSNMNDVKLVAVCDSIRSVADEVAQATGAQAYYSFEELLRDADFDVISIALPTYLHKEYAIAAAKAKKHIICEKPIAHTLEDAEEMIRSTEENGVLLFIGHVVRFFPQYANMKQVIDRGLIGSARVAHASRIGPHPGKTRAWYYDFNKSKGVIVDLMLHDLDFLRWTMGEVESVYTLSSVHEDLEFAYVTLQFENGSFANVEGSWGYPGPFQTRAEIAGDKGIITGDSLKSSSYEIHRVNSEEAEPYTTLLDSPVAISPYQVELEHFIQCMKDGTEPIVSAYDAYKALEIALAAVESAQSGQVVYLPKGGSKHE